MKHFYLFSIRFVQYLSLLLLGTLIIVNLFVSFYPNDMDTQIALKHNIPTVFHLIIILFVILLFKAILYWGNSKLSIINKCLLLFAFIIIIANGLILILFGRTIPFADSQSVYTLGQAFAVGDFSAITPLDSYLSYYPQQIGLVSFYSALIKIVSLCFPSDRKSVV